jgi:hypothetical protein
LASNIETAFTEAQERQRGEEASALLHARQEEVEALGWRLIRAGDGGQWAARRESRRGTRHFVHAPTFDELLRKLRRGQPTRSEIRDQKASEDATNEREGNLT